MSGRREVGSLYHGSPRNVGILKPRGEHGDPRVPKAVFASPSETFALAYAGRKWGDRDLEQSTRGGKTPHMTLREMRPGALQDIYGGKKGYLYEVPSESFGALKGRRTAKEVASTQPVRPLRTKVIPDALKALQNSSGVELLSYDPHAPETRMAIRRQVGRMREMDDGGAGYLKWRLKPAPPEVKQMFKDEMAKTAEPPPPKGVSMKEWDRRLQRGGKLKTSTGDVDDVEGGDPTRLMPRLRQIHKFSGADIPIEDLDAEHATPGGKHVQKESNFDYTETGLDSGRLGASTPFRLPPPARLKKYAAGMVPGAQESYYLAQQDSGASVDPELLAMSGVGQGAHMVRTSKRLADRVNQGLARSAMAATPQQPQPQQMPVAPRASLVKNLLGMLLGGKEKTGAIEPHQMRRGTPVTEDWRKFKSTLKPGDVLFTKSLKVRTQTTGQALSDALQPVVDMYDVATKAKHPGWLHGAMYLGKGRIGHLSNEELKKGKPAVRTPTISRDSVELFRKNDQFDVLAVRPRTDMTSAVREMKKITAKPTAVPMLKYTKNLLATGFRETGGRSPTDAVCIGVIGAAMKDTLPTKRSPYRWRPKDVLEDRRIGHLIGYTPKTKTAAADLAWLEKFAEAEKPKGIKFMYLNTGGGHRAQANALVEAAQKKGISAEAVNWGENFAKGPHAKQYEDAYTDMLHGKRSQLSLALPAAKFSYLGTDKNKLRKWVGKNKDQAVVVTMEHLRKEFDGIEHPVHILHSDPVKWPFAHEGGNTPNRIDIGTPNVLRALDKKRGIAIPNVPVSQSALHPRSRGRLLERGKFNVTVSAGSLGPEVIPIAEQVLKSNLPANAAVHVITGKNKGALRQLGLMAKKDPRLVPHGYAPLANMMREADLNVIRTHGTTLAETVAAGKPSVFYGPDVGFIQSGQGDLTKRTARWAGQRLGQPSAIGMENVTRAVDKAVGNMPRLKRRARLEKKRMGDPAAAAVDSIMKPRPGYVMQKQAASKLRSLFHLKAVEGGYEALLGSKKVGRMLLRPGPKGSKLLEVARADIEPEFRGMGLGRKMYGEVMRRQPGGGLHSGRSVSSSAQGVWHRMRKNPKYKVKADPLTTTYKHRSGKMETYVDPDKSVEERAKALMGKPHRDMSPNLFTGTITPKALIKNAFKLQGHTEHQGLPIAIENRKGSVRKGKDGDGKEWRTKMIHPYGYLVGTKGADGDPVDAYVGPDKEAPDAFVVHQKDKDTGAYDEDKVMLGFPSKRAAKEAFLAHYNSPKFLGPVSKVSVDRLRELVESKGKLTKISQASWASMLAEIQDMEKAAFGPADAKKVLRIAKDKILKIPRMLQAERQWAEPGGRSLTFAEKSLLGAGKGPVAVQRAAYKDMPRALGSQATPEMVSSVRQLGGRILLSKGGDVTSAIRRSGLVPKSVGRLTPQQRMFHNAAVKRHELSELSIRGQKTKELTPFKSATGHLGAEAPLTDSNLLATLPPGNEPVKNMMRSYRAKEADLLERATRGVGGRPGIEFGTQRLSRHASKRVGRRMEELTEEDLRKTLATPEMVAILRGLPEESKKHLSRWVSLDKIAAGAMAQQQLMQRFGRLTSALETHGTPIDTHKRILIPKRVLSEKNLTQLGFQGSLSGVPEAGQTRFSSFRNPKNPHHLHEHGDAWTMHKDKHAPPILREGSDLLTRAGQVVDIAKAAPHAVLEGVPATYQYARGRLKGVQGMRSRIEGSEQSAQLQRRFQRWAPSDGVDKAAEAGQPVSESVMKRERSRLIRKAGPAAGALLGAGVGSLLGARKGKLLQGAIAGLGTGATLGWVPDIAASGREAVKRYRRKVG